MAYGALFLAGATAPGLADGGPPTSRNGFAAPPAKEGYRYPDCYCTDSEGRRVEMGDRACLVIGERRVTARCGMSLNSPAWRTEGEGCPSA